MQPMHDSVEPEMTHFKQESESPELKSLPLAISKSASSSTMSGNPAEDSSLVGTSSMPSTEGNGTLWLGEKLSDNYQAYRNASKRLLIFDYDGTLTPIIDNPAKAILPAERISKLNGLASHPKNTVWIVSGRNQFFLAAIFDSCPQIGLAAEHGAFVRQPGKTQWVNLAQNADMAWRKPVKKVFKGLCEIMPESRIEEKKAAIVWHYRANQADGNVMAPACRQLLEQRVQRFGWPARVTAGKCVVEVRPDTINKGYVVNEAVEKLRAEEDCYPLFVFCVGDDKTDEGGTRAILVHATVMLTFIDMFTAVAESDLPHDINVCTKIGTESPTGAMYHLDTPDDLFEVIDGFNFFDKKEGS